MEKAWKTLLMVTYECPIMKARLILATYQIVTNLNDFRSSICIFSVWRNRLDLIHFGMLRVKVSLSFLDIHIAVFFFYPLNMWCFLNNPHFTAIVAVAMAVTVYCIYHTDRNAVFNARALCNRETTFSVHCAEVCGFYSFREWILNNNSLYGCFFFLLLKAELINVSYSVYN